jgi:hypothetical protein
MKESVMVINLHLDNFDQIEDVHEIVSKINDMAHLKEFTTSVSKPIDEVNQWFIGTTAKVFAMVIDTFDQKKWQESRYESLPFEKLQKALQYMHKCRSIPMLSQSEMTSVLADLKEFVRCYSIYVHTDMSQCFD